jgi:hypothetical protein
MDRAQKRMVETGFIEVIRRNAHPVRAGQQEPAMISKIRHGRDRRRRRRELVVAIADSSTASRSVSPRNMQPSFLLSRISPLTRTSLT